MPNPAVRRLQRFDRHRVVGHFQRLGPEELRARFGGGVNRRYVLDYSSDLLQSATITFGAFPRARLRALAELRPLPDSRPRAAEAAFTVEPEWQDRGLGDALLSHLLAVAQNRGFRRLHMLCLAENRRMQHLARKHKAVLKFSAGQAEARLAPSWPTPFSLTREIAGEYRAYARAIFHWPA